MYGIVSSVVAMWITMAQEDMFKMRETLKGIDTQSEKNFPWVLTVATKVSWDSSCWDKWKIQGIFQV